MRVCNVWSDCVFITTQRCFCSSWSVCPCTNCSQMSSCRNPSEHSRYPPRYNIYLNKFSASANESASSWWRRYRPWNLNREAVKMRTQHLHIMKLSVNCWTTGIHHGSWRWRNRLRCQCEYHLPFNIKELLPTTKGNLQRWLYCLAGSATVVSLDICFGRKQPSATSFNIVTLGRIQSTWSFHAILSQLSPSSSISMGFDYLIQSPCSALLFHHLVRKCILVAEPIVVK